jgi:hypothetical protein
MTVDEPNAGSRTPSEKLGVVLGRLHWVTRLLLLAAAVHLVGDIPTVTLFLKKARFGGDEASWALGQAVQAIGYSLTFIGGAASFEYLVLIWRELKLIRAAVDRSRPG